MQKSHTLLSDVLDYENPALIARLCRKEHMSEDEAREAFRETLEFLYLCGTSTRSWVPTKRVDTVWHHFILFTHSYAEFCEHFFGRFVHHIPVEARNLVRANYLSGSDCSSGDSSCSSCEGGSSGFSVRPQ